MTIFVTILFSGKVIKQQSVSEDSNYIVIKRGRDIGFAWPTTLTRKTFRHIVSAISADFRTSWNII
jgi:hypothetical protein